MSPLKTFHPRVYARAIAHKPNISLKTIDIYSRIDINHHIRTQQFTVQKQSIEQNVRKLAETARFFDIYRHDRSGYYKI